VIRQKDFVVKMKISKK